MLVSIQRDAGFALRFSKCANGQRHPAGNPPGIIWTVLERKTCEHDRNRMQHLVFNRCLEVVEPARQILTGETVLCQQMMQAMAAVCPQRDPNRT